MSALDQLIKQSSMSTILNQVEKATGKSTTQSYNDARKWKLTRDTSNNGSALIRFLPAPNGETAPFVKMNRYNFQYPEKTGKWYIENSLYNEGAGNLKDPCYVAWNNLKSSLDPEDQLRAKAIQRTVTYTANILVLEDKANPDSVGKVFLFEFGAQIFNMLMSKISPEFEDQTPVNIFHPTEGANFRLRANLGKTKRLTYERSEFEPSSRIAQTDEEILEIWNKCYPLAPEVAPDKFKTYEDLDKRLQEVLYGASRKVDLPATPSIHSGVERVTTVEKDDLPNFDSPTVSTKTVTDDDDPDFAYFNALANGD
jgi:hypothetical protein